jgi:hypothetical protein
MVLKRVLQRREGTPAAQHERLQDGSNNSEDSGLTVTPKADLAEIILYFCFKSITPRLQGK